MSKASKFEGIDTNYIGSKDESPSRSLSSRARLREKMAADMEAFLSKGGEVTHVDNNVMADPPRKPKSDYGSRPI